MELSKSASLNISIHVTGCCLLCPQGKPVGTPDAGAFFRVLSEYGAASMFTAPTAIRAIRQQDPHAAIGKKYPLSR